MSLGSAAWSGRRLPPDRPPRSPRPRRRCRPRCRRSRRSDRSSDARPRRARQDPRRARRRLWRASARRDRSRHRGARTTAPRQARRGCGPKARGPAAGRRVAPPRAAGRRGRGARDRHQRQSQVEAVVDREPEPKLACQSGDAFAIGVALAADGAPSRAAAPRSPRRAPRRPASARGLRRHALVVDQGLQAQVHGSCPAAWLRDPGPGPARAPDGWRPARSGGEVDRRGRAAGPVRARWRSPRRACSRCRACGCVC